MNPTTNERKRTKYPMMAPGQGLNGLTGVFMALSVTEGSVARPDENSFDAFQEFAVGISADFQPGARSFECAGIDDNEHRRLGELFPGHDQLPAHDGHLAFQVLELQLDRDVARLLIDQLQGIDVFDVALGGFLEEGAG